MGKVRTRVAGNEWPDDVEVNVENIQNEAATPPLRSILELTVFSLRLTSDSATGWIKIVVGSALSAGIGYAFLQWIP